ncbi:hypothetical protein B0T19DRAFT_114168 [Cercophora scortea]|uniref:Uncharacterized protein n=1 Tax=Cercophora scortea TaxID=314031 RepID=A0AAE0IXX1_9PEZI|nr:hypothetical protein B0T19DRAFT_114168 [Cercophora scortea]
MEFVQAFPSALPAQGTDRWTWPIGRSLHYLTWPHRKPSETSDLGVPVSASSRRRDSGSLGAWPNWDLEGKSSRSVQAASAPMRNTGLFGKLLEPNGPQREARAFPRTRYRPEISKKRSCRTLAMGHAITLEQPSFFFCVFCGVPRMSVPSNETRHGTADIARTRASTIASQTGSFSRAGGSNTGYEQNVFLPGAIWDNTRLNACLPVTDARSAPQRRGQESQSR